MFSRFLAYQADQHEKWESLVTSVRRSYDLCSEQIRRSNKDMECYTASSEHTSLTRKRDSDMQDIPSRSSTRRTVKRELRWTEQEEVVVFVVPSVATTEGGLFTVILALRFDFPAEKDGSHRRCDVRYLGRIRCRSRTFRFWS